MRHQLPVHSPLTWRAVAAGGWAALTGDAGGCRASCLEKTLAERFGAVEVLLTDSGTSALRLAIAGAVGNGERPVALPGYSCYDMATAAEGAGASVVIYDVDPHTLTPAPDSLEFVLGFEPAAVVAAHLFGQLVDVRSLGDVVGESLLIEDAAQGAGGTIDGRPLGSFGSVAVLSFGRGKGMTGGGGGALLAHDERGVAVVERARERLARRPLRGARRAGVLAAQLALGRPSVYGVPASLPFLQLGVTRYYPPWEPEPMSMASTAVLQRTIPRIEESVLTWRRNAGRLLHALSRSPTLRAVETDPRGEPGYLRLPALARRGVLRDHLLTSESKRLGVATGYPSTLAALPSLAPHLAGSAPTLPGSNELAERLITLPTHELLSEADLTRLEAWLLESGRGER